MVWREPPQVEFQGCGVPSAFAAFGGNSGGGDSDDAIDEDEPADCLSELPTRPSHLKMMRVRAARCCAACQAVSLGRLTFCLPPCSIVTG